MREAGRPWPVICEDDEVIDYMVMEAVLLKLHKEDKEAEKAAEQEAARKEFKSGAKDLLKRAGTEAPPEFQAV